MIGWLHRCRNYLMVSVCISLLLVGCAAALEVKAVAYADQLHVSQGTSVTLDGSDSTGTNLTYNWREGSTILSYEESFTHEFSAGTHTITLTVTGDEGTANDTVVVRVNRPPIADAGGDQVVLPNTRVELDASGSTDPDPDGYIKSYVWKEDGEKISTKKSFSKVFDTGRHEITLIVTDDFGDQDSDTVVIVVNRAPQADAGPDQTVPDGTRVHFDASNSSDPDGDSMSYLWKEDGGSVLNSAPAFEMVLPCGTHSILLQVTDVYGATAADYVVIDVLPVDQKPPIADAGPDQTVLVGTTVTLDASNSTDPDGTIVKYEWLDAHTLLDTSGIFEHLFPKGVHHITLIVTDDDDASGSDEVVIMVRSSMNFPQADAGTDRKALAGIEMMLDAIGSSGENLTYQWSENDTILSEERMFAHVFAPGTHNVTLTVTDEYGCVDTDGINITIIAIGSASGSTDHAPATPKTDQSGGKGLHYVVVLALVLVLGGIVFIRLKKPSHTHEYRGHLPQKPEPVEDVTDDEIRPPEPEPDHVQLKVKVLDTASRTPIPGVIVHAGPETLGTGDDGEVTFTLNRGEQHTINTSGIPNLYAGATASVDDGVATILLASVVRPDQKQDARLRSIRQAFENRYREVASYDLCIPVFYRSMVQRMIDHVRGTTAVHFIRGRNTPKEVMDRLISAIEVVCAELSDIMVSKRNIDLYAASGAADLDASECTAGSISYESLSDLIADPSGFASSTRPGVEQLLFEIDDEITSKTRDMSVLPITGVWSIAKGLLSDRSEDDLDDAVRILVADILLRYAKEMYESPEIVKRMKLGML